MNNVRTSAYLFLTVHRLLRTFVFAQFITSRCASVQPISCRSASHSVTQKIRKHWISFAGKLKTVFFLPKIATF